MKRAQWLYAAMALVAIACPTLAGGFTLYAGGTLVQPGEEAVVQVGTFNLGNPAIRGWSFGLCHDPTQANLISIEPGFASTVIPEFYMEDIQADGFSVDVLLAPMDAITGPQYDLHYATYLPLVGLNETVDLEACPTPLATLTADSAPISVDFFVSPILVTEPQFILLTPHLEILVSADPDPGTIELPILLDQIPTGVELRTQGFSLALGHDPAVVEVVGCPAAPVVQALNGGSGPDFFQVNFFPTGLTVGIVYSFGSPTLVFEDPTPVLLAQYEAQPLALTQFLSTDIVGVDDLGLPPIATVVVVQGSSRWTTVESGSISFYERLFVRGDTNDDGVIDIADGVTVLEYLFSEGNPPTCFDAANVSVDSNLDIGDPITLFNYLLLGGPPPAAPFPDCGGATSILGCDEFTSCP